jgi:endonuclease/exonuclease/phosphatase family metal-dependent hydrolase
MVSGARVKRFVPVNYYIPAMRRSLNIAAIVFLISCADPFRTQFDAVEDARQYEACVQNPPPATIDTLLVMTWNIRYGGGRIAFFYECGGYRYSMTQEEATDNIEGVAKKITEVDPDIVLLQEADICSKRSAYIDQLQYLLDHTPLNYGAYASIWKGDYIPSDGLGRIDMGNAILSKWRFESATRIALPVRTDQSSLQGYFFFHRNILKCAIRIPGDRLLYCLTVHTEPWASDGTKKKHVDRFKDELDELQAAGELFIAGGDLNALPPGSLEWSYFPDAACTDARFKGDDYTGEETLLIPLYETYSTAIPKDVYTANEARYHTFTGDTTFGWTRTLDHLFSNRAFVAGSGTVLQSGSLPDGKIGMPTLPLSDHAPLIAKMRLEP